MIFGSVCSGIEAASVAWKPLGWRAAFFSEIDPAPRAVLAHRWPQVPCHRDFTTIKAGAYDPIELLVGGTPCQSFSVAGLRGGLADQRGNLALEYLRLADRLRPRWLVWENVPGVLSSHGGRDFGSILGGMVELGYGVAYRVLDAQFVRVDGFGRAVPQRRRRVFVVGHLGDWRCAAAVLFERESLSGHPAPRREAGEGVARPIASCAPGGSGYRNDADTADNLIAQPLRAQPNCSHRADNDTYIPVAFGGNNTSGPLDVATAVRAKGGTGHGDFESETFVAFNNTGQGYWNRDAAASTVAAGHQQGHETTLVAHALRADGFDASEDGTGRGTPIIPIQNATRGQDQNGLGIGGEVMFTLDQASQHAVAVPVGITIHGTDGTASVASMTEIASALRARAPGFRDNSTTTAVLAPVQCFDARQSDVIQYGNITGPLDTDGHTHAVCIHADALARSGDAETPSPDAEGRIRLRPPGKGILEDGSAYSLTAAQPHAIAFSCKDHGADAGELAPTLRAMGHGETWANGGGQIAVAFQESGPGWWNEGAVTGTLRAEGENRPSRPSNIVGVKYADAQETGPREALRSLRDALGADATCEWQAGILASFSETEVLQPSVRWFRAAEKAECGVGDGALSRAQRVPVGTMREVWLAGRQRRSPQGRGLPEQHARELDAALSQLPHEGAPPAWLLRDLRRPSEGPGLLQSPLHPVQGGQAWAVRRLTPRECERLQGFPDDYTLVPIRGKPAADGPRYKMLGNSMAVNCMRWLGRRIEMVERVARDASLFAQVAAE